ncbi:MAG TPA: hypothetical protein VNH18_32530, partial [Bryobacteraceae bacterium]|nr:hypothetical protein [Bryobacteraceae bacterium]
MSPGPVKLIRACPPWVLRLALFLVVAIGVYLRIQRLDDNPSRSPDERMYVELASRLAHDGPFATQALFRNFVANPILWDYPSPNRSGFLLPLAAAMRLAGRYDFSVAAAVSVMASILTLLLAVGLAIRHFGLTAALGTAVVMC